VPVSNLEVLQYQPDNHWIALPNTVIVTEGVLTHSCCLAYETPVVVVSLQCVSKDMCQIMF